MNEEEMVKAMGFSSFGKVKKVEKKVVKAVAPVHVVPALNLRAPARMTPEAIELTGDNESDSDESVDLLDKLPFQASCSLQDHDKSVTSLAIDPAQSRMLTGGRDNLVKLWDFETMRGNFKPFKVIEPAEGSPVRDVQWSIKGDSFLVAPSNWQPMLFDREGELAATFSKGDPYIRDLKHVKGHTAALTSLRWHPNQYGTFMTSSFDSTIKIWDMNKRTQCISVLFTPSKGPGEKFAITSAVYTGDGKDIIAGDLGGNIKAWTASGMQTKAQMNISNAHVKGSAITSLQMSANGRNFISRAMDDTLKLWDLRNSTKPINSQQNLDIMHEEANCIYSPNERYIVTGTCKKDGGFGYVAVFDGKSLEEVGRVQLQESCVRVLWPKRMEQLFCGLSDGEVKVHYDPETSLGGVTIGIMNNAKNLTVEDYDKFGGGMEATIAVDEEPEESLDPMERKKQRNKWTKERNATKPAQPFIRGHGKKGAIGLTDAQSILRGVLKNNTRLQDPREAILRYAEIAKADPIWIAPAYQKTQGNHVLAKSVYEDEAEEYRESKKQRRK